MSLQEGLNTLARAVLDVKRAFRRAILRELGVERELKLAFHEGWVMHSETDSELCRSIVGVSGLGMDTIISETRIWKSVNEAWANSASEELV